jgi:hypothetical protein
MLLKDKIEKANPRPTLIAERQNRLAKLEGIVERL